MNENLFSNLTELDYAYLEAAYSNDAETAALVFEQYLADLPSNLQLIRDSVKKKDIDKFRQYIHKQKPGFSYVGLTDVTQKFQELQMKCVAMEDLQKYNSEIETVLTRINTSTQVIQQALTYLKSNI
jgi:hypothetical protein